MAVLYSAMFLILHTDLFIRNQRIGDERYFIQCFMEQMDAGNLVIVVGSIIINPFADITAGGVNRNFICSILQLAASTLLVYRI